MRWAVLTTDDADDGAAVHAVGPDGRRGERLFGVDMSNPLAVEPAAAAEAIHDASRGGEPAVCWSGALGDSLFERSPRTWMPAGRAAFEALCDALEGGPRVLFRPHCRHVLSDSTACLDFLRRRRGKGFGVVLDPVALLEPTMLTTLEDHLARSFESLGPVADAVILRDVARPGSDDENALPEPRPAGRGIVGEAALADLMRAHCDPHALVILEGPDEASQIEALGL